MTYLKITALVKRIRRSENGNLPLEEIVLIQQFDSEAFHRFLLEAFVLQRQSADCGTGRLRRHVLLLLLLLRVHSINAVEQSKNSTDDDSLHSLHTVSVTRKGNKNAMRSAGTKESSFKSRFKTRMRTILARFHRMKTKRENPCLKYFSCYPLKEWKNNPYNKRTPKHTGFAARVKCDTVVSRYEVEQHTVLGYRCL